uniref:Uncharacterized protein n=1 Tax=Chelydra serpentina TaxID=8475 RepID=A0A8C3XNT9_CHESE
MPKPTTLKYLLCSFSNTGRGRGRFLTWISASDTPKSRLETRSFPPVSTPAPLGAPPPATGPGPAPPPASLRTRLGPPPPARPAPTLPRPGLMISSRDMSILSAMMAAPLRGLRVSTFPWGAGKPLLSPAPGRKRSSDPLIGAAVIRFHSVPRKQ